MAIGMRLARGLNWPPDRVQAVEREWQALRMVWTQENPRMPGAPPPTACEGAQRLVRWSQRVGAQGEVGAAREALSHSGRSVEQWSEDWRRRRPGATGASFPASTSGPLTAGPVPVARPTPVR